MFGKEITDFSIIPQMNRIPALIVSHFLIGLEFCYNYFTVNSLGGKTDLFHSMEIVWK
jgi:hypothetical protein